jgi:Fe-S cluster assembly ATP-binding protein
LKGQWAKTMLEIKDLHVNVNDNPILRGLNLKVKPGEVHAIMGPNGSGKSTLSHVLAGKDGYEVKKGNIQFNQKSILDLEPEDRAGEGLFLAFQYPIEIPGVNNVYMLKAALNGIRAYRGEPVLASSDFLALVKSKVEAIGLDQSLLNRPVNEGFSGGEKKRNEVFQMSVLEPKLAILDETDSGLDIDALKAVADGVNNLRNKERSFVIVTHYQRLLDYIVPDYVHVLAKGQILRSGDHSLALELEKRGYDWLTGGND